MIQRNFPAPAWLDLKTFAPQPCLRVGGNLIAENMTELETQFVVSEMLERIPSLKVVAGDGAEQLLER